MRETALSLLGTVNAALLSALLVAVNLYQSELGGPGTIWNSLAGVVAAILLVLNHQVILGRRPILAALAFVIVGALVNVETLSPGGIRSAVATGVGLAVCLLGPLPLNMALFRQLCMGSVIIALTLSGVRYASDLGIEGAYMNFNLNPNAAAQLFFACGVVSLFCGRGPLRWVAIAVSAVLMVTTEARSATVAFGAAVLLYSTVKRWQKVPPARVLFQGLLGVAVVVSLGALAFALAPTHAESLQARFGLLGDVVAGTDTRFFYWQTALSLSNASVPAALFGHGPATIGDLLGFAAGGAGTHSSYVEAIGNYGYPFLILAVAGVASWAVATYRRSGASVLALVVPLAVYGATETFLFSGLSTLWVLMLVLGTFLMSTPAAAMGEFAPVPVRAAPRRQTWAEGHSGQGIVTPVPRRPV